MMESRRVGDYTLYRERNAAGGFTYYTDEIGGGAVVWDTVLASKAAVIAALDWERESDPSVRMRRVVIESPLSGDRERNKAYAYACALDCLRRGESPYASHLLFDHPLLLDDDIPEERELGIKAGFSWGEAGDIRAVYKDFGVSGGMKLGIEEADRLVQLVEHRLLPPGVLCTLCGGPPRYRTRSKGRCGRYECEEVPT